MNDKMFPNVSNSLSGNQLIIRFKCKDNAFQQDLITFKDLIDHMLDLAHSIFIFIRY